jgi:hypothetical protein
MRYPLVSYLLAALALFGLGMGFYSMATDGSSPVQQGSLETVYIRNLAPRDMSDATIERDIPAWEKAANRDFAPVWETPHVKIVLLHGAAPRHAIVATFKHAGPISGALAFHTIVRGEPNIVVYTGVGNFYGYSNSVSFTHELFETMADQFVASGNLGTAPYYYISQQAYAFPLGAIFVNEVCDPVEAYQYRVGGVAISDFITPNYFADGTTGGLDFLNILQHPFQIARGGYQIVELNGQWQSIVNFRHAGRDAAGFLKGEKLERS